MVPKNNIQSSTKLSDLIIGTQSVLPLLVGMEVKLGFGQATIGEICSKYQLPLTPFITLCNIYADNRYEPDLSLFSIDDLPFLIKYI